MTPPIEKGRAFWYPYSIMAKQQKRLDGKSFSPHEELLALLQKQSPEIFTEGKIDCKKLKATLGESVDVNGERYGLSWAGKNDCFRHIQEPTTATLKPIRDESVDFDTTKNLFIEGDNLQALKVLQKSYYGQVKMIYIDPPYNTGSDSFIYPDRFQETQEEYMERVGDKEEGHVTRDGMWQKNSGDNGHYHSNWLSMMYPRLFLARNLLRDDGVIFVSIDDHEEHNLRIVMNEIFGEENFIDSLVWKKRYQGAKEKYHAAIHEYILVYAREIALVPDFNTTTTEEFEKKYFVQRDEKFHLRSGFRTQPLEAGKSMEERINLKYTIPAPDGTKILPKKQWIWSEERTFEALKNNELDFSKDSRGSWSVRFKQYLKDERGIVRRTKPFSIIDSIFTQNGTKEINAILGDNIFQFPKPSKLVKHLLDVATGENDKDAIIVDFFAGSGTTAHAVMQLNTEDGGTRRCISVQLAEECEEGSEAQKAGFKTIADISKERIRRAAKKIKKETGKEIDYGFKAFKLDESNFKIWRSKIADASELLEQMHMFIDNLKAESTQENVLYELMLKTGLDLNVSVEVKKADGKKYFVLDDGKLVVCLEDAMTQPLADAVIALKPQKVICLDGAFKGNDQLKTNTALQMEAAKIDFRVI